MQTALEKRRCLSSLRIEETHIADVEVWEEKIDFAMRTP